MHVLALHALLAAQPHQGVFKVFGATVPGPVGEFFHWIAHTAFPFVIHWIKLIAGLFILLLMWRRGAALWQLGFAVILGWVVFPGISPKVNKITTSVTHGSAVGSTGASVGMLALLGGMIAVIFILLPILKARSAANEPGEGA